MDRFEREQKSHWAHVDIAHASWRTCKPVRRLEEALFRAISNLLIGDRLLDVGCGEGDALRDLRALGYRGDYTGIDFSREKVAYARRTFSGAELAVADATRLPFRDHAFPTALCRDLLHHVRDRAAVVDELLRVADRRVVVIEPNPLAPLIAGLGLVRRAERGIFRSWPRELDRLLVRPGWLAWRRAAEPHSLARLVFHYHFGVPALARFPGIAEVLAMFDRAAEHLPETLWSYQVIVLDRAETS
jgi:SAM-dependent methyltransferase